MVEVPIPVGLMREEIDAELIGGRAINVGKTNFQKNLGLTGRGVDPQEVDDFAHSGSDIEGAGGGRFVSNRAV